jgi:hypothetical protein
VCIIAIYSAGALPADSSKSSSENSQADSPTCYKARHPILYFGLPSLLTYTDLPSFFPAPTRPLGIPSKVSGRCCYLQQNPKHILDKSSRRMTEMTEGTLNIVTK